MASDDPGVICADGTIEWRDENGELDRSLGPARSAGNDRLGGSATWVRKPRGLGGAFLLLSLGPFLAPHAAFGGFAFARDRVTGGGRLSGRRVLGLGPRAEVFVEAEGDQEEDEDDHGEERTGEDPDRDQHDQGEGNDVHALQLPRIALRNPRYIRCLPCLEAALAIAGEDPRAGAAAGVPLALAQAFADPAG